MEQKFDVTPSAEIRLEGPKVVRSEVKGDWGLRLQWQVSRDGKVVATPPARADLAYQSADTTPGSYEIVLQTWKYIDYKKDKDGQFVNSQFIDISNKLTWSI